MFRKIVRCIAISFVLYTLPSIAAENERKKVNAVEGTYKVQSVEKKENFTIIYFEKYPSESGSKSIVLEVENLGSEILTTGSVLDISAEVVDKGNVVEAEQMLLNLPRGDGKTRVWLLSRKGKTIHFKGSFLKMHSTENDYLVM